MELVMCRVACIEGTMQDTPAGCTAVSGFTYFTYPCLAIHWRLVEAEKGRWYAYPVAAYLVVQRHARVLTLDAGALLRFIRDGAGAHGLLTG